MLTAYSGTKTCHTEPRLACWEMNAYRPISSVITVIRAHQVSRLSHSRVAAHPGNGGGAGQRERGEREPHDDQAADEQVGQRRLDAERRHRPAGGHPDGDHEGLGEQGHREVERGVQQHHQPPSGPGPDDQRDRDDVSDGEERQRRAEPGDVTVHAGRVVGQGHRHVAHALGVQQRQRGPLPAEEEQARRRGDGQERPGPGPVVRRADVARDEDMGSPVAAIVGAVRIDRQQACDHKCGQ